MKISMGSVALVVGLGVALAGCDRIGMLKAKMAFKSANTLYQQQDYRKAVEKYEEALSADPNLTYAYFFLGNSYDNLYKTGRKGESAANDALLTKAIANYKKAAEVEQVSLQKRDSEQIGRKAITTRVWQELRMNLLMSLLPP